MTTVLEKHLRVNNLEIVFQSAHNVGLCHCTEIALVKVTSDILDYLDENKVGLCLLTLLDLSAAFDTIDHAILVRRLEETLGLSRTVLIYVIDLSRLKSVIPIPSLC